MTQQQAHPVKMLIGDIAFKFTAAKGDKPAKEYVEVKPMRDDGQLGSAHRCFDANAVAAFKKLQKGQTITADVMDTPVPGKTDQFYHNITGMPLVQEAVGAEPTPAAKPAQAPAVERQVAREDPTRRSIERQTALIQAVAFAGHYMTYTVGEKEVDAAWVLEQAQAFLGFLTEAKAEPKAAMPEQAMQLRAATLAKANGLKPFGLIDWCQDPSHAALPQGTKWADATLEQKTRALDIFEAAHQEAKP